MTAKLNPDLHRELNAHRSRCLAMLRECTAKPGGTKYNIMSPYRKMRRPSWTEIELTPDITFSLSEELVGKIIPAHYTRALKRMIQLQARILAKQVREAKL